MSFQQIKPQKNSELVAQEIKKQIRNQSYTPGAKLPTVIELAESFNVGRSTIREALSALKAIGWVTIRHGGGTYVNDVLPNETVPNADGLFNKSKSFLEVLEVRKFIEVGCATLAADRRTEHDLTELAHILQQMEEALGDEEKSELADIKFHLAIAKASHNSLFMDMMESMTQRLQESIGDSRKMWFFAERATAALLLQEHRNIYSAIEDKDEKQAAALMMQHIMKVDQVVQRLAATDE